ncbi:heavy metal-responsive transcriptional regulator [Caldimonas brevitalea]|uniref:Transcriptional regulator, MerR family n=1 Tax=Caldimonas brevitalea TaxID=413882 RepID=A0A0G3BUA7_9BURK|nr:heavy metal-responsive transcriptional regulator [Caldimonas brevitalea]AKJ30115.1 transcriptional regulator, MerR family [Caldimonas brevitalea]
MNIGALAQLTGVSTDTLRYYEKEGLLERPARAANGYRVYGEVHAERVRFVRGAQALGFSLSEIRWILPKLDAGQVVRADLEKYLMCKVAEIDAHIRQLRALKKDLLATFGSMGCAPERAVTVKHATNKSTPRERAGTATTRRLHPKERRSAGNTRSVR